MFRTGQVDPSSTLFRARRPCCVHSHVYFINAITIRLISLFSDFIIRALFFFRAVIDLKRSRYAFFITGTRLTCYILMCEFNS